MPLQPSHRLAHARPALLAVLLALAAAPGALAQTADRERAQMMQLQQQLQHLQQDKSSLEAKAAKDSDELKKRDGEVSKARGDLARARAESATRAQENEALRAELDAARDALAAARADIERLTTQVQSKDASLATAARLHRQQEQAQTLLADRLKHQTSRGDLCEVKHAQAMTLAASAIDAYEKDRLRICEPVTGIWRVHQEESIQQLRDRLYESRLDVPLAKAEKP